jgi:gluconolactonase
VTRIEIDGSISVIAQKWNGKRLNSRNQAVVAIVCLVDAKPARSPRSSPIWFAPNGIAFSPDEKYLYVVVDTGATHKENGTRHIRCFRVDASARAFVTTC